MKPKYIIYDANRNPIGAGGTPLGTIRDAARNLKLKQRQVSDLLHATEL